MPRVEIDPIRGSCRGSAGPRLFVLFVSAFLRFIPCASVAASVFWALGARALTAAPHMKAGEGAGREMQRTDGSVNYVLGMETANYGLYFLAAHSLSTCCLPSTVLV